MNRKINYEKFTRFKSGVFGSLGEITAFIPIELYDEESLDEIYMNIVDIIIEEIEEILGKKLKIAQKES